MAQAQLQDIAYGPDERNVLDVYVADTDERAPVYVFIQGGGFRGGDKSGVPSEPRDGRAPGARCPWSRSTTGSRTQRRIRQPCSTVCARCTSYVRLTRVTPHLSTDFWGTAKRPATEEAGPLLTLGGTRVSDASIEGFPDNIAPPPRVGYHQPNLLVAEGIMATGAMEPPDSLFLTWRTLRCAPNWLRLWPVS